VSLRTLTLRTLSSMLQVATSLRGHAVDLLQSGEFSRTLLYNVHNRGMFENIVTHEVMVADTVRMKSYHDAIDRYIGSDDVVVDLGTGTGILCFLAARRNPKKIYAIDHSDFIRVAKKIAEGNGITGVSFIQKNSRSFEPDEEVDVILHEQMGSNLIDENMVENILDLKRRVLKSTGRILPGRFELFLEPICLKSGYKVPYLWENSVYGIDFGCLRDSKEYAGYARPPKLTVEHSAVDYFLCEPKPVMSFDLNAITDPGEIPTSIETSKEVVRSGSMDGICLYFRVLFDDEIHFDTSPFSLRTHWNHPWFRTERRQYARGETIAFTFTMDVPTRRDTWAMSIK